MSRAFMIKQAPFKPTDIGGCKAWFDSFDASYTTTGNTVTAWTNKSGNANATTGSGTVSINQATLNGKSSVRFPAGTNYLNIGSISYSTSYRNQFFVVTVGASGSFYFYLNCNDTICGQCYSWNDSDIEINRSGTLGLRTYPTGYFNSTSIVSICTSSGGNTGIFVNGVSQTLADNNVGTGGFWSGGTATGITLGGLNGFTTGNLDMYELLQYDGDLTRAQRLQIESYLAQKWGRRQQLPQGHPGTRGIVYPSQPIPTAIYWRYPTPFVPTNIGGCQLWLDGVDPAGTGTSPSNGATVSTWVDKATAKNATATGTSTYLTGGGINFTGSSYFLNQTFSQNLSQRSIFIVFQETTNSQYAGVFPIIPTPSSGNDQSETNGLSSETTNNTLSFVGISYFSSVGSGNPLPKAIYYDSMNGTIGSGYFNGTNATNVTAGYTAGTCSGYGLGGRWQGGSMSGSYRLNGVIYEILFFNTSLNTLNRQTIEGYLAWKWGIQSSLPSNHPYKNVSPNITNPGGVSRPANVLPIPPITCTPILKAQFVSSGLVNRWIFNNGSGSTATDTVGGQNISLSGTYTWSSSVPNTAIAVKSLSFDGYSGFGSAAVNATLQTTTYSMSMWYYHTGNSDPRGNNPIIIETGLNQNEAFAIATGGFTGTSKPYFYSSVYNGGFFRQFSSATPLNTWTHLVVTIGSSLYNGYQNGVLDSGNTNISITSGLPFTLNGSFIFGKGDNPYGDQFGGSIFDVRIYNRVLTAAEVASIYAGTG